MLKTDDTTQPLIPELECATGESGYVWLNTPALMKGYFRRDDLTAKAVVDGWFMTGDIGCLDDAGRLFLRGRERDEINKGGMKIYPSDIDAVVERFAAPADVCAFALDDPIYGQAVGMAVVLNDTKDETIRGLHGWMKSQLAEHKMPSRWWAIGRHSAHVARQDQPRRRQGRLRKTARARPAVDPCRGGPRMNDTREQRRQDLLQFLRSIQKAGMPVESLKDD